MLIKFLSIIKLKQNYDKIGINDKSAKSKLIFNNLFITNFSLLSYINYNLLQNLQLIKQIAVQKCIGK